MSVRFAGKYFKSVRINLLFDQFQLEIAGFKGNAHIKLVSRCINNFFQCRWLNFQRGGLIDHLAQLT